MPDPLVQSPRPGKRAKSAKPAPTFKDLTYVAMRGDQALFSAPSSGDRGRVNWVGYDTQTGDKHCDCKWCQEHPDEAPRCWHAREVEWAWWARQYHLAATNELIELDRRYAAAQRDLEEEQLLRWNMVGDELGRRNVRAA